MIRIAVDPARPDPAALAPAARALREGGLVVFPTETVYGLGANALDPAAVARIFAAKGRPSYNPLIVHLPGAAAARALAAAWPDAAERLAAAFWPGPLTLVLPKNADVPDAVTAGLASVALRVPAHPVARALLAAAGVPVAAPSANRSGAVSPTTAEHVVAGLGDRVDVVVDGGPCPVGIESTVVSLVGAVPTLLRPGTVSTDALREVVGEVALPSDGPAGGAARPSPGMLDRHYAPRAILRVVEPGGWTASSAEDGGRGRKVGALLLDAEPPPGVAAALRMPGDPAGYAARLYAALHEMDAAGCDLILVEPPPEGAAWAGIRDRLRRAETGAAGGS